MYNNFYPDNFFYNFLPSFIFGNSIYYFIFKITYKKRDCHFENYQPLIIFFIFFCISTNIFNLMIFIDKINFLRFIFFSYIFIFAIILIKK